MEALSRVMVHRLGRMSFANAFALQKELLKTEQLHLLFVEHPPVYTCGRRHFKDIDSYLSDSLKGSVEYGEFKDSVEKIDRGGNVTFHGEGQLVIYPIFSLNTHPFKKDLYWYLRSCEDVIIDVLNSHYSLNTRHGFECYHDEQYTGVWVRNNDYSWKQYKICAVGIGCSRWRTFHGLAFNVNTDLDYFQKIIPCGISEAGKSVINLADIVAGVPPEKTITKANLEFNEFSNDLIDACVKSFELKFNIKCSEK